MRLAKKGQVLVRDGTVVTDSERQKAPTPSDDLASVWTGNGTVCVHPRL